MKTLRIVLCIGLIIFCLTGPVFTQNWSPPITVTSGAGDDHHVDIAYYWYENLWWMAWDRTEEGNTDIYARSIDFATGQLGDQIRLTVTPSVDEKPSVVYDLWDNGIVYQSDLSGMTAIYYIRRTHEGTFLDPWLSIIGNEDLFDPVYSSNTSDITVPCIFFHSDSSAQYFEEFDPYWEISIAETYHIAVSNVYPVRVIEGYWYSLGILGSNLRWVWEYESGGFSRIGYDCSITSWPYYTVWYTGTVPNDGCSFHNPKIDGLIIYMEREQFDQYDIVCTTLDTAYGGFPLPQDLSSNLGDEKNPAVKDGNVVFETNVNSNWDIAFWNASLAQPEIVDTDPADDLNPIITLVGDQLYVFWESDRDGVWHIYYSTRDAVGVEPRSHRVLPDHAWPGPGQSRYLRPFGPAG
ncbi:MAG: hypothetical protein ACYS32_19520 [Planctomycetota bacterium]|jgi:hypothetical protein